MRRFLAVGFVLAPFASALIRISQTGSDSRMLWMALASLVGTCVIAGAGVRSRTPAAVVAWSNATLVIATLVAGSTAFLLGATASPGVWSVSGLFGLCSAASYFTWSFPRPLTGVSPFRRRAATSAVVAVPGASSSRSPEVRGMRLLTVVKHPSAFLPVAMSLAALALVVGYIAMFGAVREPDEGAIAHLWQLLMAAQMPFIALFAFKWLPRAPRAALQVLALQAAAAIAALAPVYTFNL